MSVVFDLVNFAGGVIWSGLVVIGGANHALLEAEALFSISILLTTGSGWVKRFTSLFARTWAVFSLRNSQVMKTEVTPA